MRPVHVWEVREEIKKGKISRISVHATEKSACFGKVQPLIDEKYRPLGGRQLGVLL